MFKAFIISVGIAFSIQIIHSILTKGWRFTLEFFAGGFIFGFVREFVYFSFIRSYEFPNMPIKLLNVPIFIPIGWVFTFYLAHEFVNNLIEPKTVKDYKDFIIFAALFSTFICIPIETAAMNMNWWTLSKFYINDHIAPFLLMGGWFYTSVVFFYIYFVVNKALPQEHLLFVVFLLISIGVMESGLFLSLIGCFILIIVFLGMFKHNKEISLALLVYAVVIFSSMIFMGKPNAIFVTITFIFIFIYIPVKLYWRNSKEKLIKNESFLGQ